MGLGVSGAQPSELGSLGHLPSISLTPEPQKLCDNLWVVLAPPHQTLGIVREDVVVHPTNAEREGLPRLVIFGIEARMTA